MKAESEWEKGEHWVIGLFLCNTYWAKVKNEAFSFIGERLQEKRNTKTERTSAKI